MTEFAGRTAVVTGGGSGMGRELVRQLVAEACNVACATSRRPAWRKRKGSARQQDCRKGCASRRTSPMSPTERRSSGFAMRSPIVTSRQIHLLFDNAGISGGGSMVTNSRDEWERTFNICWAVSITAPARFCRCCKTPRKATSSIPAALTVFGRRSATHPAYRLFGRKIRGQGVHRGADHRPADQRAAFKCSVVMPGQIGTSIRANTRKIHSGDRESDAIDAAGLAQARERFALLGRDVSQLSDDQLRNLVSELERRFRDEALTSAAQAATIILDGVKADRWRILVGVDAHKIDEMVRQSPDRAYDIAFFDEFARAAGWTERLSLENPDLRPPN